MQAHNVLESFADVHEKWWANYVRGSVDERLKSQNKRIAAWYFDAVHKGARKNKIKHSHIEIV